MCEYDVRLAPDNDGTDIIVLVKRFHAKAPANSLCNRCGNTRSKIMLTYGP